MTEPTRIFHNPRCSKSRQTLSLLEERGITPEIIRYLDTPPTAKELSGIIKRLGTGPRAILRKGEAEFRELGLDDQALTDMDLIEAMAAHPKLIERPIVLHGTKAAVGRPPENVLTLFDER